MCSTRTHTSGDQFSTSSTTKPGRFQLGSGRSVDGCGFGGEDASTRRLRYGRNRKRGGRREEFTLRYSTQAHTDRGWEQRNHHTYPRAEEKLARSHLDAGAAGEDAHGDHDLVEHLKLHHTGLLDMVRVCDARESAEETDAPHHQVSVPAQVREGEDVLADAHCPELCRDDDLAPVLRENVLEEVESEGQELGRHGVARLALSKTAENVSEREDGVCRGD